MTNASAIREAGPAQAISSRGRFFADQTFHFETLRNAGYIASNCAELGEVLETVKVISEGDVQSWYAAWKATADRVLALAERTQDIAQQGWGLHARVWVPAHGGVSAPARRSQAPGIFREDR